MPYLVYWYGTTNIEIAYAFVKKSQFTSYDVSKKPKKVVVSKLAKLEVGEDLEKEPRQRRRGVFDFMELWELITDEDILEAYGNREEDPEEDPFSPSDDERIRNAPEFSHDEEDDDEASVSKKRKLADSDSGVEPRTKKKKGSSTSQRKASAVARDDVEELDDYNEFGENDEGEDDDDDDFKANDDSDDADEDFVEMPKKKSRPKIKQLRKTAKKAVKKASQAVKRGKRKQEKASSIPEGRLQRLLTKWDDAIKNSNTETMYKIFDKLLQQTDIVDAISDDVMQRIGKELMPKTKTVLKEKGDNQFGLSRFKEVRSLLKDKYDSMRKENPSLGKPSKEPTEKGPNAAKFPAKMPSSGINGNKTDPKDSKDAASFPDGSSQGADSQPTAVAPAAPSSSGLKRQNSIEIRKSSSQPRKKFSLGSLMGQNKQNPVESRQAVSAVHKDRARSVSSANNTESSPMPSWMSTFAENEPLPDFRSYALHFLLQLAEQFPADKVNASGFARALEKAAYEDCKGTEASDEWKEVYWQKIHAVVAGVAGKQGKGTLFDLIIQGKFQSPSQLVQLDEDILEESFEGRPVSSSL